MGLMFWALLIQWRTSVFFFWGVCSPRHHLLLSNPFPPPTEKAIHNWSQLLFKQKVSDWLQWKFLLRLSRCRNTEFRWRGNKYLYLVHQTAVANLTLTLSTRCVFASKTHISAFFGMNVPIENNVVIQNAKSHLKRLVSGVKIETLRFRRYFFASTRARIFLVWNRLKTFCVLSIPGSCLEPQLRPYPW